MNAIKALEMLSPIPEDEFIRYRFSDFISKCCVVGHLNRLTSKDSQDYEDHPMVTRENVRNFRENTRKYLFQYKNMSDGEDIADINNSETDAYDQETQKDRIITLLKDMIEDGWVD